MNQILEVKDENNLDKNNVLNKNVHFDKIEETEENKNA